MRFLLWNFCNRCVKMSSLRNALPRKAHKERSQPWVFLSLISNFWLFWFCVIVCWFVWWYARHSRKKFGLLEKHKDYVERARAFHRKEETLQVSFCSRMNLVIFFEQFTLTLLVCAHYRNLRKRRHLGIRMSSTSTWLNQKLFVESTERSKFRKSYLIRRLFNVFVHNWVWIIEWCRGEANKYTKEELMLMKTQDIGYILQKLQSEKKVFILLEVFLSESIELLCRFDVWTLFVVIQKIEKLNAVLHSVDNHSSTQHVYYAEDRWVFVSSLVILKYLDSECVE